MTCKRCIDLISFIKKIIFSTSFLERSRRKETDFTRTGLLSFASLILYLCNFPKSSYQPELNKFFKIITGSVVAKQVVSKVALCNARKKLKYEAFVELNSKCVQHFHDNFNPLTWNGFYLKAVDGSTAKLPNFTDIVDHFGAWGTRRGDPVPMARLSRMYDPLNRITAHALIKPKSMGEREMAAEHFEQLADRDLVLPDRGYPAFWFFVLILSGNAQFCARISSKWKIVKKFIKSGGKEQTATLPPLLFIPKKVPYAKLEHRADNASFTSHRA